MKKADREEILEKMKDLLSENLSQGSGINGKWTFKRLKDAYQCFNAYDNMNEVGMYDRVLDFSIKVPDTDAMKFKLHFHVSDANRKFIERDDTRSYLEDTIAESLEPILDEYNALGKSLTASKSR